MFFNPYNLYNPYNQSVEDWQNPDPKYRARCVRFCDENNQEKLKKFLNDFNEDVCELLVGKLTSEEDIKRVSSRFPSYSKVWTAATSRLQELRAREEILNSITVKKMSIAKQNASQKKPLILSKEIKLFDYYVKGTVACMEKCFFPKPLLLLLKEENRLVPEVVAEKLLQNGYHLGIAKAWLDKILALGLIHKDENDHLSITEQGIKYLENGQCFVPKEGEWIVTCCKDARVGNPIFSIRPLDSSRMMFDKRKELSDKLKEKMSSKMDPYVKEAMTSAKEFQVEGNIYMFRDVNVEDFCIEELKRSITLNWNVTEGRVWLNYDGRDLYEERLPEWARETESELIQKILEWRLQNYGFDKLFWDEYGLIHVPFNKGYGSDMLMSLKVKDSISRTSAGEWSSTEISCGLVPATEMDAKQWCNYLFARSANKIMTKDNFEIIIKDVESKMKLWKISISDRLEYLNKMRDAKILEGRNLMLVNAVLDWQL